MILLSLLIVIFAERVVRKSAYWSVENYVAQYRTLLSGHIGLNETSSAMAVALMAAFPAILVFCILHFANSTLLSFVVSTLVLFVCVGCPTFRENYRGYLEAASRGDDAACALYQEQVGYKPENETNFGRFLVWVNYQHYAAVVLWFIVLGAAGAVFYVLARSLVTMSDFEPESRVFKHAEQLRRWVDFVPVRVSAFGLLLVGNFSNALPLWLAYLLNMKISPYTLITRIAKAAEDIEPMAKYCTEEPCSLVRLAKRNMMFLLATASLLTITGWIA